MSQLQKNNITHKIIGQTIDWAYKKALTGFVGVESAYELADNYLQKDMSIEKQVKSLIHWQTVKNAAAGFATGIGGLITLPLSVPANIAGVMYVQIRMICAIAHMGGYDIKDDRVKTFIYISLVGNGAKDLLKSISIKFTEKAILKALTSINTKVTINLATKIGQKSALSVGKAIPILGGIVGGSFDAVSTEIIGRVAKKIFIDEKKETQEIIKLIPKDTDYIEIG